jgi:hypothetical protein
MVSILYVRYAEIERKNNCRLGKKIKIGMRRITKIIKEVIYNGKIVLL